jgi:tetratricopeptide (TPR) repeat protein
MQKIKHAAELIEKALWDSVRDEDHQKELREYEKAKQILETLPKLSPNLEKERNTVLSYCLMRMDSALVATGDTAESVKRMKKALAIAEKSQEKVQIARCLTGLGARLASAGFAAEAEENWNKALALAEGGTEYDVQQIVGWTHIVKARFLNQQGKHMEALKTAKQAETILETINNYAGVANATTLMADIYKSLNDNSNEQRYRVKSKEFWEKAKTERR